MLLPHPKLSCFTPMNVTEPAFEAWVLNGLPATQQGPLPDFGKLQTTARSGARPQAPQGPVPVVDQRIEAATGIVAFQALPRPRLDALAPLGLERIKLIEGDRHVVPGVEATEIG